MIQNFDPEVNESPGRSLHCCSITGNLCNKLQQTVQHSRIMVLTMK
uniref:Uncharacterized protein n=1 Tax=Rhizophora mucronata TaxID=61149 RepID=A0A2P2QVI6_RHIMU